jgi:hypothetical protein
MTGAQEDTLAAIADRFVALRSAPPDLPGAVASAFGAVAGPDPSPEQRKLQSAGDKLAHAIDATSEGRPELPYHNRHHFAETVLAMGWLCHVARERDRLPASLAGLGIIAMAGHDWGHDGSCNGDGRLESQAAEAVLNIVAPLPHSGCDVVRAVIIGTDPARVPENAARACGKLPASRLGRDVDLLCQLANEADVFASFLPALAWQQAEALAEEWRGTEFGAKVATYAGRLSFLRMYDCFSTPARSLGLAALRDRQVDAFTHVAERLGAGVAPEDGAAALDHMPRDEAHALYSAMLSLQQRGAA